VGLVTKEQFVELVANHSRADGRLIIGNHNLNSLAHLRRDSGFRAFFERSDVNFIDSAWVGFALRAKGYPVSRSDRLGVLDWIDDVCVRAVEQGLHIVHVGSQDPTLSAARRALLDRHPGLRLTMHSGFFDQSPDSAESLALIEQLHRDDPDIVLLGLGMPLQEHWLDRHLDLLPPCVIVTVGGVMGYLGGDRPTPPRWLGRFGLEWLYRLVTEPRRLWRRYLIEPLPLVRPLVREIWDARSRRW
jgi:N-acetylglucosaminyldiphosphoundecaprenol N-acetyl-beta-D-mannosaminyltransferase